jgi:multidrug efflux pump subunit AcrA (membrane-fusion protein)
VSHEDLHPLLPRYAAGDLDEAEALAVREHLATGCPQCLETVFQPHQNGPSSGAAGAAGIASPVAGASRGLAIAFGLLALLFAASTGWMFRLLSTRETERREAAERTAAREAEREAELDRARAELERTRGDLEARAAAAATARAAAEEDARRQTETAQRQTEAAQANAEAMAELARQLEGAQARIAQLSRGVRSREAEIGRLLAGAEVRALGDLAATPGVQVQRLVPSIAGDVGRGHVLWHPARERIMLYVFDLPAARYRVRLWLDGDVPLPGPDLRLGTHGEAAAAIELGVRAARLRAVEVLREPGDGRVLEGRLPAAG